MRTIVPPARTEVAAALREEVAGTVVGPGDTGYHAARAVWSGVHDRRPAAIVRPRGAGDVAAVVRFAAERGVELAVRGGGHGPAGHGTSDGGVVLDLSQLRDLAVDPRRRAAWAGAGLTAGEVTAALARHGLAVGFGDASGVGIAGLTLGGGIGYLSRAHGLTIDNLLAAELVTADGRLLQVDEVGHPDLFWAIRGGGGNFGVATRLRYRLRPVATVTAGTLSLPATPDVLAGLVAAAADAPDGLTMVANVVAGTVLATLVHAGPPGDGARAVAPFRALARPLADTVRPMPYAGLLAPGAPERGRLVTGRATFIDAFGRDDARSLLDLLRELTGGTALAQVRVLGGAVARVPADATAFAHRRSPVLVTVGAAFGRRDEAPLHEAWAAWTLDALGWGGGGAYVNFLGDEGPARVRAAYPGATWDRLRAVKRRHDPGNVFRMNHNIPPA